MVPVEVTGSHLPDISPSVFTPHNKYCFKKKKNQINTCKISLALPSNINKALKQIFPLSRPEVLKLCAAVAAASPEGDDFQELSENSEEDEGGREKKNEDMPSAGAANPGFTATHSRHPDLRLAAAR